MKFWMIFSVEWQRLAADKYCTDPVVTNALFIFYFDVSIDYDYRF